jgi:hypothetical protein
MRKVVAVEMQSFNDNGNGHFPLSEIRSMATTILQRVQWKLDAKFVVGSEKQKEREPVAFRQVAPDERLVAD